MKISIITPSYNQGSFIGKTIESVLNQSYQDWEYWIIDGGSTDNTLSVIQAYDADPRLNWISEPDSGQSNAINKGIAKCTGDMFSWLCSDDLLSLDALEQVANCKPSNQVVYGLGQYISSTGDNLGFVGGQSTQIDLAKLFGTDNRIVQPATFIPLNLIKQIGGIDEALHYCMDFDLWIRLAEHITFQHIPSVIAFYRLHDDSKTVGSSLGFGKDWEVVLGKAVDRGTIDAYEAQKHAHYYWMRIRLLPDIWDWKGAMKDFRKLIESSPSDLSRGVKVISKAVVRKVLGDTAYKYPRYLKPSS